MSILPNLVPNLTAILLQSMDVKNLIVTLHLHLLSKIYLKTLQGLVSGVWD